jgi:NADH:ubiquinone oxidoreductase subunit 5 (subunit L)/multisubunit Na+/H+ antiporter MnhA subunit
MKILLQPILISMLAGCLIFLIPNRFRKITESFSLLTAFYLFAACIKIFLLSSVTGEFLYVDGLSGFITLGIGFFGALVTLYSMRFMSGYKDYRSYYAYVIWTIGFSILAALANNLIILIIAWGLLGFTLYMLINISGPNSSSAAKKAFIIIGGTDSLMILGFCMAWIITGSLNLTGMKITIDNPLAFWAFLLIAAGAFAKAGVMPFHTWVPDTAKEAPIPVTAFLPASLDKLLGIYLLARLVLNVFILNKAAYGVLMVIGSITILAGVMMALVQHDFRKLLGYHAVSQVGYMVLGFGTGTFIGIAAGLFHLVNHAIYKCCLFLTAGNVIHKTGKTDLDSLGGLAKIMPITFFSALIAALSISGVPPFNGFFSKWMIYQSLIEKGREGGVLWIFCMVAAIFGSALTLASFIKLIHAIFLGKAKKYPKGDVSFSMWVPTLILAGLCVVFGIFAYVIPLKGFIVPALSEDIKFIGTWMSLKASLFLVAGLVVGLLIYMTANLKAVRETAPYIGGEDVGEDMSLSGTEFYSTIEKMPLIKSFYCLAEKKVFDIYEQGKKSIFSLIRILQYLHNGVLPTYLVWCLIGMILFIFALVR